MDGVTLDHLIAEMRPRVLGRHVDKLRLASHHVLVLGLAAERERLWLDAGRGTAGLYLLPRETARALEEPEEPAPGRARQALLLLRKHLRGARISGLARIPGERTLVLEAGGALLCLRVSGTPSLTLALEGSSLATLGDGAPAWPLPQPAPEREWDRIDPGSLARAVALAPSAGRSAARAILAACPPLGPLLAREIDGTPASLEALRARLVAPRPTLLAPGPLEECHDADLAPPGALALAPIPIPGRAALHPASWVEAAALYLQARRRGARFESRRRRALESTRREARRLLQLESHLSHDLAGLADAEVLRRHAEALLVSPAAVAPGAQEVRVPDPYEPALRLRVALDPRLSAPANADRLFAKARRIERARVQVEARLGDARRALEQARSREARVLEARDLASLEAGREQARASSAALPSRERGGGPRHYLTSRGLSVLVGRGARENHHLTFALARPEDVWLHARDVPGAHVILRDSEGRASADDLREAAEVAAFFSQARDEARVDVHVTRRKHVRPAAGGPGRVRIAHSETLRAIPLDPEGRLRKR